MKPFDLYNLIRSINTEPYNQRKLPFFMMRSKKALDNLHHYGWDDEQIKVLVYTTYTNLLSVGKPTTTQFILSVLCYTTLTPGVQSTEEQAVGFDNWIEQEKLRVNNAK